MEEGPNIPSERYLLQSVRCRSQPAIHAALRGARVSPGTRYMVLRFCTPIIEEINICVANRATDRAKG
jgi:hypothetical protein